MPGKSKKMKEMGYEGGYPMKGPYNMKPYQAHHPMNAKHPNMMKGPYNMKPPMMSQISKHMSHNK